jgi:Ca2+-binding RTX toxin-like protein
VNVCNDEDLTTTNSADQNPVSRSSVFAFANYEEDSLGLYSFSKGATIIGSTGNDKFDGGDGSDTLRGEGGET